MSSTHTTRRSSKSVRHDAVAPAKPMDPCHRAPRKLAPAARFAPAGRLTDAQLQRLEDKFLDSMLDHHPRRTSALDRLLDDLTGPAAAPAAVAVAAPVAETPLAEPVRRIAPVFAPSKRLLIERLLVGAVIDHHPNRERALDRLLDDVMAAPDAEQAERARFDMTCDNDFDGLG